MDKYELYDKVNVHLCYAYGCLYTPSKGNHVQEAVSSIREALTYIKTFIDENNIVDRKLSEYIAQALQTLEPNSEGGVGRYMQVYDAYKVAVRSLGRAVTLTGNKQDIDSKSVSPIHLDS